MSKNTMPHISGAGVFDSQTKYSHGETRSSLRTTQTYEIEFYPDEGGVSFINDAHYVRQKNSILIAKPGDRRYSSLPFRTYYFYLSNVCGALEQVLNALPPIQVSTDPARDLYLFQDIQRRFLSANPADELASLSHAFLLLHHLSGKAPSVLTPDTAGMADHILSLARQIIDSRFSEPLTVEDLATECHISLSYLHRIFADEWGTSPYAALNNRRITEARTLLTNTDLSMSEIAYRCGFRTQAHFSECFKRKTGVAPSVFRKNARYEL